MGEESLEISETELLLVKERPGIVTDRRRRGWHFLHNLVDILIIELSAALRGWTEFEQMDALGLERETFFKRFLELPRGIPDADTFNQTFTCVHSAQLLEVLKSWYGESGKGGGILTGKRYGGVY
jgi:hypothetical protein